MESETQYRRIIGWFQDHTVFSWVLFVFVVLGGAGTVTGAIEDIVNFARKYLSLAQKPVVEIKPEEMIPIPKVGFGYHFYAALEAMGLSKPDTLDLNHNSRLVLLQDGRPLGPAHSGHKDIEDNGQGRYSHWLDDRKNEYLYFSASDNSDPRTNGRVYALTVPGRNGPPVVIDPQEMKKVYREGATSFGYRYRGSGLRISTPDSQGKPNSSRLVLLEDGKRLGPGRSPQREVSDIGRGRYGHWHDGQTEWLFFSTSDNSDPRANGRVYAVTVEDK